MNESVQSNKHIRGDDHIPRFIVLRSRLKCRHYTDPLGQLIIDHNGSHSVVALFSGDDLELAVSSYSRPKVRENESIFLMDTHTGRVLYAKRGTENGGEEFMSLFN